MIQMTVEEKIVRWLFPQTVKDVEAMADECAQELLDVIMDKIVKHESLKGVYRYSTDRKLLLQDEILEEMKKQSKG